MRRHPVLQGTRWKTPGSAEQAAGQRGPQHGTQAIRKTGQDVHVLIQGRRHHGVEQRARRRRRGRTVANRLRRLQQEPYPIFFSASDQLGAEKSATAHPVGALVHVVEAHVGAVTASDVRL